MTLVWTSQNYKGQSQCDPRDRGGKKALCSEVDGRCEEVRQSAVETPEVKNVLEITIDNSCREITACPS
jgi:hypothetical protein